MSDPKNIMILEKLTDVLEKLGISYAIGGSMASSAYGTIRFTQDADITVEPFEKICSKFFDTIKDEFYVSKEAMLHALQNRSSFNIIHFATAFKIDIFIRSDNEFQKQMFLRRRELRLGDTPKTVSFVSPEDIILLKLDWYMQSDCTSERQWTDVLGILKAQASAVDFEYLKTWANKLGLKELLARVISEVET